MFQPQSQWPFLCYKCFLWPDTYNCNVEKFQNRKSANTTQAREPTSRREGGRKKKKYKYIQREREKEIERGRERERDRDRVRARESEREREKAKETDRETEVNVARKRMRGRREIDRERECQENPTNSAIVGPGLP